MVAPSISFDDNLVKPLWGGLSLDDVQELICGDVAELSRLRQLQAEDVRRAAVNRTYPNYMFNTLVEAWEQIQDIHWSWRKEIRNARNTGATQGPEGLGAASVGSGV